MSPKPLEERLKARIAAEGPIPVADYMAEANAHYYATRDPFGVEGDFTTAPEISQMFGELIGIWCADLWQRAGEPRTARYVELGPGRGTLAEDALRAMRGAGLAPPVDLVETSKVLRAAQAERLSARWHDDLSSLSDSGPLLVVANEFFDALPVRQYDGSREVRIFYDGGFVRDSIVETETSPAALAIVGDLATRLVAQGGAALIFDYGHDRPGTAHVDFHALASAARAGGVRVFGPAEQGAWLNAMGIKLRAASLAKAAPERGPEIAAARARLTAPDQMGRLFKAMALVAPGWPEPAGF
jgi:NADH dehydrogenase [ubiquinone] 1 alpha subcomplex assembly factor 7